MQPIFSPKNHFSLHYAAKPLFYKTSSVLLTFGHFSGQKKCPFLKNFPTYFLIFFCLKNFHEYYIFYIQHVCSQHGSMLKARKKQFRGVVFKHLLYGVLHHDDKDRHARAALHDDVSGLRVEDSACPVPGIGNHGRNGGCSQHSVHLFGDLFQTAAQHS